MTALRAPRTADVTVAAGCWLVVCTVLLVLPLLAASDGGSSVTVGAPGGPGWWFCFATVTAQAVVLAWVRLLPRAALLVVAAVPLPLAVAATGDLFSLTSAAITVAVFLVGIRVRLSALRFPLAVVAIFLITGETVNAVAAGLLGPGASLGTALLQAMGAIALPLLLATVIRGRREARDARRHELAAIAREHDALVKVAIADERTAMARELHDIAAHHLSGIALLAAAVDHQIDTDTATAKRSVKQIRAQSMTVLADLRRLVGLLRDDDDAPRSVESLAAVTELVEQRRAAGAAVTLRTFPAVDGRPLGEGIGPLAQLAVYRVAQESLTNAATHAPGAPAVVELDDREDVFTLSVTNVAGQGGSLSPGGFGLIGMRERADLLGATLHYGATAYGGWEVRMSIPRDSTGQRQAARPRAEEEPA